MTPSWFLILESFFNRSEKKAALLFTCSYSVCGIKSRQLLRNDVFAESFIYRIKAAWKSLVTSTENCSRCHCFMFTFHDSAWRHLKERRRINCTQQKLFFLSRWRGRPPPASFGRASVDLSHHKLCAAAAHQLSQQLQTTHTELADLSWLITSSPFQSDQRCCLHPSVQVFCHFTSLFLFFRDEMI